MSWGGGTDIMYDTFTSFEKHNVTDGLRFDLYVDLIESLRSMDWGDPDECIGPDPMYDKALEDVRRRWCESHGHDYDERYGDRP
jgi:hypothetical protein